MSVPHEGDLVLLVSADRKRYLIRLKHGDQWFSHRGSIGHDEIIGQPLGRTLYTQHGYAYLALEPSTHDLLQEIPRASQIIYGKDAAQIILRLSLLSGAHGDRSGHRKRRLHVRPGTHGDAQRAHLLLRNPT
jgi:tRNA (adenine57-N1/adenine58-N1)-methyltransferase